MRAYQRLVKDLASKFEKIEFERISREMNVQADRLAYAVSTSVEDMRVAPVELLLSPSIPIDPGVMQIDAEEETWMTPIMNTWMTPIMNYLTKGTQPNDPTEARKLRIKATRYAIIDDTLFPNTRKCDKCQRHALLIRQPAKELNPVVGPWPFTRWGMDIVGPLPTAVGAKKFVLLATDYFIKWVEA
ncbi:unnamed protein product [Prunus brigantina]